MTTLLAGKPYPLGATWDGAGVNFALFAERATAVDLCLFAAPDTPQEAMRIAITERTEQVWHIYVPNLGPGQCYGYRVHGPYAPADGLRYNPHKLLLDPYARAVAGSLHWDDALYGYTIGSPEADQSFDERDSAPFMQRGVVIDPSFDWGDDQPPDIALHDSVIYELHVKGFTHCHPALPEELRGTYAGLAAPEVIAYLTELGITAVELLPIHHFLDDRHLIERGLRNYWGYNTLGFFAPDARFAADCSPGGAVREFKALVKALHAANLEVILDVVYNHTAEGNHLGPTLSFKGIDNPAYYRLMPDARYYLDYTGTGNTLNVLHPRALQLITDSLRYWVQEMHVDGFRFDLAAALARGLHEGDRLSAFFDIIHQDPVLARVKLIAEPWDLGPGGYQVGNFPVQWAEWNGRYRDTVRRFWKGDEAQVDELAYRLSGSSDLYEEDGRRPYASVNFLTAHDGFTLRDLVSYNEKHNEANGEDNRDGESHNNSWNCGVEGPTDDPAVNALRARQQRNLLATLLLSQGVPMLTAGDERGRTQGGNNNAYCQDSPLSWLDWQLDDEAQMLLAFTRCLIGIRREHPVLHRRCFFHGRAIHGQEVADIAWYRPDGAAMSADEWDNGHVRALGLLLNGQAMDERDPFGLSVRDDTFLLLVNAHHEPLSFALPAVGGEACWEALLDTARDAAAKPVALPDDAPYLLDGRALALLRRPGPRPVASGTAVDPNRHPLERADDHTISGTVMTLAGVASPQLGNTRDILVYLPPTYANGDRHYPVLYMHEGQNLFDQATSYADEWGVDETMEALAAEGLAAIIVGIPNSGDDRLAEYTPFRDRRHGGGRGDDYLAFIVETLKPQIDRSFRTRPEREATGIVGSSLGGLISLYAYFRHPEVFGRVGALSPALWFANRSLFRQLPDLPHPPGRLYLDVGLAEGRDTVVNARRLATLLGSFGYDEQALRYVEVPDGDHSERAWAARLRDVFTFLLQP